MSRFQQASGAGTYEVDRLRIWRWGMVAMAASALAIGLYLRWSGLLALDVFCRVPDEFSELMPGLRLHALPFPGLGEPNRYSFVRSALLSHHGLGDVSLYYLASSVLSLLGLPVTERTLWGSGTLVNAGLALAGGLFAGRVLRSATIGLYFAALIAVSPFFVYVSVTGWGRLTWTPLLVLAVLLCQVQAMERRGRIWPACFCIVAAFTTLTDAFVNLPIVVVLGLVLKSGSWRMRLHALMRDRIFLAGMACIVVITILNVAIGLRLWLSGTGITLVGYILERGSHGGVVPSWDAIKAFTVALDHYSPFSGAWVVFVMAFALASVEGVRRRSPIAVIAAWWFLAAVGVLRYMGSINPAESPSWLNAYNLAVPSLMLLAWALVSQAGPLLVRIVRSQALAPALLLVLGGLLLLPMARDAHEVAFGIPGTAQGPHLVRETYAPLSACRVVKATAFYIRSRQPDLPYVFHLSSNVGLGHVGEFYYGLSYGYSDREPNRILDFGVGALGRKYDPRAFYKPYGVEHFDYYVDFVDDRDEFKADVIDRLFAEGAHVVLVIKDGERPIGRVLSFSDPGAPVEVDYAVEAAGWNESFGKAGTLFKQQVTGTAYVYGYQWRRPE